MIAKLFSAAFAALLALPVMAAEIRLLNWEDYLSPEVLEQWEQQSDHRIKQVFFDNDEKRDAILMHSDRHNIDIAVVDEVVANRFGKEGKFVALNETNVPSLKHIDPFWRQRCGDYAVPYLWGTLGLVYRSDKFSAVPTSWNDLLQPKPELKGHIALMDDYTDMLAPALFASGFSLNTENQAELKTVFEVLKQVASDVLTFDYAITYLDASPNADQLYLAMAYSGDQTSMNITAGQEDLWQYVVPEEGTVLWVDCLAVPVESPYQAQALSFLDFINQPLVAASNSEKLAVATPNTAALALLPAEFANDQAIFPDESIIKRSQLYHELSNQNIELRLRITNAVMNIYESSKTR